MKVLILHDDRFGIGTSGLLKIQESAPRASVYYTSRESVDSERFSKAEIIFGLPEPGLLRHAASLRWLHLPTTDVEGYTNLGLYANRNVVVTKAGGVFGAPAAEHALALLFALSRQLAPHIKRHEVPPPDEAGYFEIAGSAACVLGLGDIGREVARRLHALDCRVIGLRRNIFEKPDYVDELCTLQDFRYVLNHSNIVVSCLPATAETRGILDADAFSVMRRNTVLISVGSPRVIDLPALAEALRSGVVAGAGLDIPEREPEAFPGCENLILTPRVAGSSQYSEQRQLNVFIELCRRFTSGRALLSKVDFFSGY